MTKPYARFLVFARQALHWWLAELAGMVPAKVRQRLSFTQSQAVLEQDGEGYAVYHVRGTISRFLGRLNADLPLSPNSLSAAIGDARLARRVLRGKLPLTLRLPAGKALVTRLTLPVTVKADLPQILRFEMDRRTPFSAASAFFAYDAAPAASAGKLDVIMTVIAKAAVTDLLTRLAPLGVAIRQVTVAGMAGAPASGNLLPSENSGNRKLRLTLHLATVAIILIAAFGLHSIWQDGDDAVAALRQDMARLRKTVEQVEAARAETERLQAASAFLSERRRTSLTATQMLADLTRTLPDDTWLVQISMHDDKLQISGYSAAAAGLIEKVMQSPAFRAPQFRSAVTQDAAVGRERFELVMTVAAQDKP
jgi:general secretion pathway protein L